MTRYYISPPPMNPIARIIASLFGVLLIVGAVIFGFFVLVGGVVLGLVAWTGFAIRRWWLRRKGVDVSPRAPPGSTPNQSETIEAEYTVISRRRD